MAQALNLKASHKAVKQYYADLAVFAAEGAEKETTVRTAFFRLLDHCARRLGWHLNTEYGLSGRAKGRAVDVAVLDDLGLPRSYCEAKDAQDDLDKEIRDKFDKHYPAENIIFWQPGRAVIYQGGRKVFDEQIGDPALLVAALEQFFGYLREEVRDWSGVVDEFREVIPRLGQKLVGLIEEERGSNPRFVEAFAGFSTVIREAVNPNLSDAALEEMLIQHILTERIFRNIFDNPDFVQRNAIANEIEKVVTALTSGSFSKTEFMKPLERFYASLEEAARTVHDFAAKQTFLNTVYERFFQGFSVKAADTLGIVYTPQPIVEFMVNSVESLLQKEFGLSLGSEGVHILDPFVGTGNFIVRIMRRIAPSALPRKFKEELHCNELMLLPYYIAALNIEHEYLEQTGHYAPFDGICLVDTFGLAEAPQQTMTFLTEENTQRVQKQRDAEIMVIIGNPPYNAHQANENDDNKNRRYPAIDGRVRDTYTADSTATNKNAHRDPYVKAFRWAADRLRAKADKRGIVAFVSNNSFLDNIAFDGMRMNLAQDFDKIYVLDLKGNARTSGERRRREAGNIFSDEIRVGVSICLCVSNGGSKKNDPEIFVHQVDDYLKADHKKEFLNRAETVTNVKWRRISPSDDHVWLTEGMDSEFDGFLPMGTRAAKAQAPIGDGTDLVESCFKTFSNGVKTNRDAWAYNFDAAALEKNIKSMIQVYNHHVVGWQMERESLPKDLPNAEIKRKLDEFVDNDPSKISWSRDLKQDLLRKARVTSEKSKIRRSLYRPFCESHLYFDRILNEEVYRFPSIFPTEESEKENRIICTSGIGSLKDFQVLQCDNLVCLDALEKTQCFPFYTYNEDGSGRRENVTDWALARYRARYGERVSKWDIFHYCYGLLHHPEYRERFAANLRRSLPHIPEVADAAAFRGFAEAGEALADLHVNYERQPRHPGLREVWRDGVAHDLRVEKMRFSKDRRSLVYNDSLVIADIPPEAFEYRLGSRSALEWVVDQYRVKTDKASGIVNDPNRKDEPGYIIELVGRVVTVSLETNRIVAGLPPLKIAPA